jgi:hypothetical protein
MNRIFEVGAVHLNRPLAIEVNRPYLQRLLNPVMLSSFWMGLIQRACHDDSVADKVPVVPTGPGGTRVRRLCYEDPVSFCHQIALVIATPHDKLLAPLGGLHVAG